jgi:hypothetical protein
VKLTKVVAFKAKGESSTLVVDVAEAAGMVLAARGDDVCFHELANGRVRFALKAGARVSAFGEGTGKHAVVTYDGQTRGGVYQWKTELLELATGKARPLATNRPDDNLGHVVVAATGLVAERKRRKGSSTTQEIVRLGLDGKERDARRIVGSKVVFHLAVTRDERTAAHVYFTGKGALVDLATGKESPLVGGSFPIGRQHEKGVSNLLFDDAGAHLLAVSGGAERVSVWKVATRKTVSGAWKAMPSLRDAFFLGDRVGVVEALPNALRLHVMPVDGGEVERAIDLGGAPGRATPLGDGRHVVWAAMTGRESFDKPRPGVRVWDALTGKRVAGIDRDVVPKTIALAAAGHTIVVGGREGDVAALRLS